MPNRANQLLKFSSIFENKCLLSFAIFINNDLVKMLNVLSNKTLTDIEVDHWLKTNESIMEPFVNNTWVKRINSDDFQQYSSKNGKITYTYIGIDPKNKNSNFDIIQSSILKGTENIPNLKLIVISVDNGNYLNMNVVPSKNLSHNYFILESIAKINHSHVINKNIIQISEKFLEDNKAKIDKLKRFFEYNPKLLGGGADGVAFDIGSNRVLKLFKDKFAFDKAKEAIERLYKNHNFAKTEAMIYDIDLLGVADSQPIYYYVMEKMAPVMHDRGFVTNITKILDAISYLIQKTSINNELMQLDFTNNNTTEEIKLVIQNYAQAIEQKIRSKFSIEISTISKKIHESINGNVSDNWLTLYIEEVMIKFLTGRKDLHAGNLGVTMNGQLRYFDPSYRSSAGYINNGFGEIANSIISKLEEGVTEPSKWFINQ